MAIFKTITTREFLSGEHYRCGHKPPTKHKYRAHLEGNSVVVTDESGERVEVNFGATQDHRTVYCHVDGVGFIGGWTYPHKRQPFRKLVDCINRGKLYDMNDLPKSSKPRLCPHCGKEI